MIEKREVMRVAGEPSYVWVTKAPSADDPICPHCRKRQMVRVGGEGTYFVSHLNVGVYCPGSLTPAVTDDAVKAVAR